ncbi:hypothetical protein GCM10022293_51980 [Azospirillum formosense]
MPTRRRTAEGESDDPSEAPHRAGGAHRPAGRSRPPPSRGGGAPLPQLTLWGPPAGPSITLVHAIASGLLPPVADKVVFKAWRTPDELRAGLTSGTMQTFVLPTQSAANRHCHGNRTGM